MPMPAIINPKNMEEYKAEKDKEKTKKPQFTTVKWGKSSAKEGEEIELSAQVKDIDDGNMVTLQVWKDGQDPASGVAWAQLPTTVDGGVAKGEVGVPLLRFRRAALERPCVFLYRALGMVPDEEE